ncbi:MAG: GntR family transcriptional regulator [Acidimicrobiia bacterium]|nr:GntR family transcriptional regulator [Acidimicrobiia bacterium]
MILRVDPSQALPVYEQIRQQVTRMAVTGTLAPGTRLPTIRQLAADLGLAKGTVAKAYELLELSAVVESKGHKGTFVRAVGPAPDAGQAADGLRQAAEAFVVAARQLGADLDRAHAALDDAWLLL